VGKELAAFFKAYQPSCLLAREPRVVSAIWPFISLLRCWCRSDEAVHNEYAHTKPHRAGVHLSALSQNPSTHH